MTPCGKETKKPNFLLRAIWPRKISLVNQDLVSVRGYFANLKSKYRPTDQLRNPVRE